MIDIFVRTDEVPRKALEYHETVYTFLMQFRLMMERNGMGTPTEYLLARYLLAVGDIHHKVMYSSTSL